MGSSKNRSSFRIADILHPQQPDPSLLNGHSSHSAHSLHRSHPESSTRRSPEELPGRGNSSQSAHSGNSGHSADLSMPHKPTAMYPSLMDLHKANAFPLPFPLGMHPFHQYLDYANAMHKGKFNFFISI